MFNLQIQAKSAEELKHLLSELLSELDDKKTVGVQTLEPIAQVEKKPSLMGVENSKTTPSTTSVGIKQVTTPPSLEILKAGLVKWRQEAASEQIAFFKSAFNGVFDFSKMTKEQMEIVASALNERGYLSV